MVKDGNGKESCIIRCPGCDDFHVIRCATATDNSGWTWNGDLELPSFVPSLLVTYTGEDEGKPVRQVCHSYILAGSIRFLEDCTHALKGKTVELPEVTR